jgi:hypothetical protein
MDAIVAGRQTVVIKGSLLHPRGTGMGNRITQNPVRARQGIESKEILNN